MDKREFDVIVWGASGFTGRLVAAYMLERYGASESLRWALGGRNQGKLTGIRDNLGETARDLPLVIADSNDADSLAAMVKRTKVICTTVGPYAKYGSELVRACAAAGTHYCDLAGEPQWMHAMIEQHQQAARASGACIVHACGFDSIPSDMGVYYMQREAVARLGEPFTEVHLRLRALKGAASGGTIASLLNASEEGRADRNIARILVHPYSLNPEGEREGPDTRDQTGMVFDENLKAWTAPFVMAMVNTKVVRRGHALMGYPYGKDFRYSEATLSGAGVPGWFKSAATSFGLGGFMVAASVGPLRNLMQRFVLPEPGEGPNKQQRESGFFNFVVVCKTRTGEIIKGRITGDRDPGYGSTSKMLSEAAVCLALDEIDVGGGFWTPASAMGDALLDRLVENAGLSFSLEDG